MFIMTPQQFQTRTGVRGSRTFSTGFRKSSAGLVAIYDYLNHLYNSPNVSKVQLEARWRNMTMIVNLCTGYIYSKQQKGSDMTKDKYVCVQQLEQQVLQQLTKEKNKAAGYGALVNQAAARGVALGQQGGHKQVKYERAFLGNKKDGTVVHGKDLYDLAVSQGVKLTGDDARDAYVLRAFLKQNVNSPDFGLERLEYLSSGPMRAPYELDFHPTQVYQNGAVFHTDQGFVEGEDGAATFAISGGGDWYARVGRGELTGGTWHHSSFMGGDAVMLAGTIRVSAQGTLQYISNNSGHYAPNLDQLWDGADQIKRCGLNRATRHKCSILAMDHVGKYQPIAAGPRPYLFPYTIFHRMRGNVPNPTNYEIRQKFSEWYWTNPAAARPDSHCNAAPDGKVVYPGP